MKTPPVSLSVLIPNYNHAAYLVESLESAVSQSCQPAAIHVIDDASTDRSVEIIRSYVQRFPQVHLIQKKKNCGVSANINEFLPQLQGSHFLILPADDYLLPGAVERAHDLLSKHPDAGLCLMDLLDLFPGGEQRYFGYRLSPQPAYFPPTQAPLAIRGRGLAGQCFFHLDGLRRMGGFPPSLRWHGDHFAASVLAARYGLCYVPKAGGVFRKLPTSWSAEGVQGPAQQEVMASFLDYLFRPEYADIKSALRDSHVLAIFDRGLFSALWRNPGYRYFLTPSFTARLILRRARRALRHPVPRPVKEWYRRLR